MGDAIDRVPELHRLVAGTVVPTGFLIQSRVVVHR